MNIKELKEFIAKFNDTDEVNVIDSYGSAASIVRVDKIRTDGRSKINICVVSNFHSMLDQATMKLVQTTKVKNA